jgi:trimeric autotransporter adhesin
MLNIYTGNVITDDNCDAIVTLPDYFTALNRHFRYQLTVIGQFAQAIVADEIANHRFTIKTDKPRVKLSWQVTGIRQDAWPNKHRIKVEEEKPDAERGYFLHPELYDQPEDMHVEWARRPEPATDEGGQAAGPELVRDRRGRVAGIVYTLGDSEVENKRVQ